MSMGTDCSPPVAGSETLAQIVSECPPSFALYSYTSIFASGLSCASIHAAIVPDGPPTMPILRLGL